MNVYNDSEQRITVSTTLCRGLYSMNVPEASRVYRILTVDDDPISLAVTVLLLEAEGHQVLQAESGERAIEILGECPVDCRPDVILADLQMPGISGPALAGWLRPSAPGARLIAMSATPPAAVDGYDAVLRKPLSEGWLQHLGSRRAPADAAGCGKSPGVDTRVFSALQRSMPPAALREVCEAFFEDSRKRVTELRTMAEAGDFAAVRRLAHTLKGSASMIGASGMAGIASVIETGEQRTVDDLLQMIEDLTVQSETVESMLLATIN
ncbi:Hpt domain-containing response regulator [Paracidobacterium acidisoli]|uniref:Response regulator n=1 Tax=Paracidobacterium acidisoli TaxID=2303751 RepID=A0A372IQB6_9BACT|nr:response regulator [Paracidobacterium acidisoli]MBT9331442.1 response regulator [Paracidobacterium acidisoli]